MQLINLKAIREVRTKETFKNNKLTPFVQYEKQPANRSLQYFIYSNLSSAKNNHSSLRGTVNKQTKRVAQCYSEHQGNFSPMIRLPDNIVLVGLAQSGEYCSKRSQLLGVMPKCSSLSRQAPLTHELKLPFPAIASICANNSSSKRICFIVLLGRSNDFFSFLSCIGNYQGYNEIVNGNYHNNIRVILVYEMTKPRSASNTNEASNHKQLFEVTVMALYKSTQTHPKFTDTYWIIRLDSNIPYGKVSLTHRERRLFHVLFKGDRLVWSGRKPITPQSIIACSASQRQEVAYV